MSRIGHGLAGLVLALAALMTHGRAEAQRPARLPTEADLVAVLRSDAPEAEKAITCKWLAIYGSSAAVPELAALLGNERLASWARIALEAIPGPAADAALRTAAETLRGRLLVGVINSLGVRGDAAAVPLLVARLRDPDADVAAAAAAALGRIGTAEAATALAGALAAATTAPGRDVVAESCVVAAEKLRAGGRAAEATAVLEAVRRADVSEQRQAEAIRGLILTRGIDGVPLLVETLRSPTRRLANMGLFTARELGLGESPQAATAEAVDLALVAELQAGTSGDAAAAERAALVATVLADRSAGGARPQVKEALLAVAGRGPKPLRLAAIAALGRAGTAAELSPLLQIAADPDPGYALAVREAIASLPAGQADTEIRTRLATADAAELPLLAALVGDRRIPAVTELVALTDHAAAPVRLAALAALGPIVDLESLDAVVRRAMAPRSEAEGAAARKALAEASVRMPDRDACAAKLAAALEAAPAEAKIMLLDVIGNVGGPRALAAVATAGKSGVRELDDVATRILGKWMTADAAPVLLELAGPESPSKFRTRALRGYLRIARQFDLPVEERAEMCRKALGVVEEEVDRTAIIEILKRYPAPATNAVRAEAEAGGAAAGGRARRIVLVAGDEEYRSEEALPQLGRILGTHHGFDCTVLFPIDPVTGEVAPDEQGNIPGLEALRKADLMVIATRFRNLPDGQMKEIDDYLRAGKPVVGMRTATHAFNIPADRAYAHYGNGYAGEKKEWADGFGRLVLGEKWISHHGKHQFESTRGVIAPGAAGHPILRGIADGDIWGPTDVYGVRLPLPGDSQPLVLGQVLSGMTPDSPPVAGSKNDPMMPIAWTKTYAIEGGPRGRVFTTTMGAATDLASEGMRRLVVNGCYWALGLEDRIPAKSCVDVVGTFDPTPYGFNGYRKGLKPGDL